MRCKLVGNTVSFPCALPVRLLLKTFVSWISRILDSPRISILLMALIMCSFAAQGASNKTIPYRLLFSVSQKIFFASFFTKSATIELSLLLFFFPGPISFHRIFSTRMMSYFLEKLVQYKL